MNNTDAFSGLGWGDLGRYQAYNDNWIREKRIADWDRRIAEIDAAPRNLKWALTLRDLWAGEITQNKDILPSCKGFPRLKQLKDEAQKIMQAEKDRIDALHRADADAIDVAITALEAAARTPSWPQDVLDLNEQLKQKAPEVRQYVKKTATLQKLVAEATIHITAQRADADIRTLSKAIKKDDAWQKSVQDLSRRLTAQILPLITEKDLYEALKTEYLRVQRSPVYSQYEALLRQVEGKNWDVAAVEAKYNRLTRELSQYKYSMGEYIPDFQNRWTAAKNIIAAEHNRAAAAERARRQAEIDRNNKAALQPYLNILNLLTTGHVTNETTRGEFHRLDGSLHGLGFTPDQYSPNFSDRWRAARDLVAAEERAIAERERIAEEKRRAAAAAKAEAERKMLAKAQVGGTIVTIILHIIGFALTAAIIFFGFEIVAAVLPCRWYTPFVVTAAVYFYLLTICNVRLKAVKKGKKARLKFRYDYDDGYYNAYTVIEQILLYGVVIAASILSGYGVFNIIICCAAAAVGLNTYHIAIESPEDRSYGTHICQAIFLLVSTAVMVMLTEFAFPSVYQNNSDHIFWYAPLVASVIVFLVMITTGLSKENNCGYLSMVISGAFGLLTFIRIGYMGFTDVGWGIGMLFFLFLGVPAVCIGGCFAMLLGSSALGMDL